MLVKGAIGDLKILASAANAASKAENIYAFEATISTTKTTISALENAGAGFASGMSEEAVLSSIHKFQKAKAYLTPYKGIYMPEDQLRNLIKEASLHPVPRLKGIPENFRVKISKRCSGIIYADPEHEHTSIRLMLSKPHSPNPV